MQDVRQLSQIFAPHTYTINLAFARQARAFKGKVTIQGELTQPGPAIPLHAKELALESVMIDGHTATFAIKENDEIECSTNQELAAGDHQIEIAFSGNITDQMHGLYPCYFNLDDQKEELLATQFESHHAREVFPCVDEPAAKAVFELTLQTEKEVTVIANTPVANQKTVDDAMVTTFEPTPKMSTYLLAWVVGKLAYKEAHTKSGVTVRTYATPTHVEKTAFSLDVAVKTLELLDEYFQIPYPLAKCDIVGLPDFSSGAMENWGCITFRESLLFVDEYSSVALKQRVAEVVAHELAHQWFGNLVTMKWWNDLWLNESFATWMATYVRDQLFPEWQAWTQFFNEETSFALDRDSLKSIQSVQQDVHHPDEIGTLFDSAIVYGKGACLVHMVYGYMGSDAFQKGLAAYMQRHAYQNATSEDLWQAWSEASGKDIGAFMTPWISQPGHPMLSVRQQDQTLSLTQQRFYSNPKHFTADTSPTWPVPLLCPAIKDGALLQEKEADFTLLSSVSNETPLLLNQNRSGFYPVLYSPKHIKGLTHAIKDNKLSVLNRLGLLNDAYDLARAGQQPTLTMLELLAAYKDESEEPVWGAISSAIGAVKMLTNEEDNLRPLVRKMAGEIAQKQHARLGWARKEGESYFDQLLRPVVLRLMCFSKTPATLAKAKDILHAAKGPEAVLGDIRSTIFSVGARHGSDETFDRLLSWHKESNSPEIKIQLIAGLCSAKDPERIHKLISLLKTEQVKPQDVFYWVVYLSGNRDARDKIWQWIKDEWQWITDKFGSDTHYSDFPRYMANSFSRPMQLDEYKTFFEPLQTNKLLRKDITQGIENINARIAWRERDLQAVRDYLQQLA